VASIFTRIIAGELSAHFVWRDERCVAFLSIGPLRPGHTLVVPRVEVDHWIDLDDDTVAVVCRAARQASADCVVTRNEKDFAKSPVPAYSPTSLLGTLATLPR